MIHDRIDVQDYGKGFDFICQLGSKKQALADRKTGFSLHRKRTQS